MNDDEPDVDPVDAELIAYLDGELEPAAARELEDRLDADPKLRARAEGLKRSYDLLDFLPKPEPSATFATRTMDKLPVSGSKPVVSSSSATTMTPAPLSSLSVSGLPQQPANRTWAWAAGIALAAGLALGVGYLGTAALRMYVFPAEHKEPGTDSLSVNEVRVITNLPLYAGVDDYAFLLKLDSPDFFGDELASPDWLLPGQPVESEKPADAELQSRLRAFRELPPERQDRIRDLDQRIHTLEPPKRDRMMRLLETYTVWLHRLPESERKKILGAAGSSQRLELISDALLAQWVASLPAARRKMLKEASIDDKLALHARWRAEEEKSRTEWAVARVQWETLRTGKQPWPFTDDKMKKDVIEFVHIAYRPDDPKRSRLGTFGPDGGDLARVKDALDRAGKGECTPLGRAVYDFAYRLDRRYEMLPEPAKGEPITEVADLPAPMAKLLERGKPLDKRPKWSRQIELSLGKWPDFALAVHTELPSRPERPFARTLGPCRPDEFKDDLRRAVADLEKKLSDTERTALKAAEGSWPEYPRKLIAFAKERDLSLPGVLPPGPPSLWEKTYNPPRQPMRPGG